MTKQKHHTPNISKEEWMALHSLQKDRTIVITKSDTGNTKVVINKKDYDTKAFEHPSTGSYRKTDPKHLQTVKNKVKSEKSHHLK